MGLDEALLDAVSLDPSQALLRTYGWTVPTLSLGYFQSLAASAAAPGSDSGARWVGQPVVRRLTGGGAIWHHHELTYALVIPAGHPLARPRSALYHGVHSAIASLLRACQVRVERRGPVPPGPGPGSVRPFLCFNDCDPEDLVDQATGIKIVGSAQRRRLGAILQHGSLLLKRSPTTPELAGIGDLSPASSDPQDWAQILVGGLPQAIGLIPAFESLPEPLRHQGAILAEQVYRNPAWNRRR
jgi:lipoate-protein ligase A